MSYIIKGEKSDWDGDAEGRQAHPSLVPPRPRTELDDVPGGFDAAPDVGHEWTNRSYRDNPVMPEIQRQLILQPFDERRAVLVEE